MEVTPNVQKYFKTRELRALELIKASGIAFTEIGIFGSYARGTYKTTSDIDFCIVVDTFPNRAVSGTLRQDAEDLGADIVYVQKGDFYSADSNFMQNLRNDYRRLL